MPKEGTKVRRELAEQIDVFQLLVDEHYISDTDAKEAQEFSKKTSRSALEYLFSEDLVTKDIVGQALAEYYSVPYSDLNSHMPGSSQVRIIPEDIAKEFRVVLFENLEKSVVIATDNPKKPRIASEMKKIFGSKKVQITYSLSEDIDAVFVFYRKKLETRFGKILEENLRVAPEIIEEIFEDAVVYRASDIHFEPQGEQVLIRFRVDGVLQEAGRISKVYYSNVLNRIKVQSRLRIDEHFAAQDGAIRYEGKSGVVDMRVSIVPTLDGEKVVIRVLSEYVRQFTLSDLGLSSRDQQLFTDASKKPHGMILVTGPTGSGKSTSLYSLLKTINRPDINIMTIEDPVEYRIVGINQIQVNTATNLTFAKGLRSIVRQDPDVILVGEIRDEETAEIAVNAALTGHLLFSTFHANDAATTIPRLLEMGTEPFLLASTLELVIAQRLVRKICESCRTGHSVTPSYIREIHPQLPKYFSKRSVTLYKGKGCPSCNYTGYQGRIAIFEFIPIFHKLQELILRQPSSQDIWKLAESEGTRSLFDDGLEKVKNGVTTLEELMRVTIPPS